MTKAVIGVIVALVAALALFGSGGAAAAAGCDGGMVVPLPVAHTLTSGFGLRSDPTGGGVDRHTGQDLAAPAGTPVLAAAAGTIVKVLDLGAVSYGLHVVVEHSGGVSTWYAHLSAAVVSVGQLVAAGDPIGQVGSSGRSTGPHLHFEVRLDGVPTDPALWFEERGLVLDGSPGRSVASLSPAGTAASCPGTPVSGDPVVAAAQRWLGTPYSWGGGTFDGPSSGLCCSPAGQDGRLTVGFDCSGLVLHAWFVGSGGRVALPHSAAAQHRGSTPVPVSEIRAGDLLFFSGDEHVGIADGLGGMVHAPRPGKPVETVENVLADSWWGVRFDGAARPVVPDAD